MERILSVSEAATAAQIQTAIDEVAKSGGGRVVLPAMDLELDRGWRCARALSCVGRDPTRFCARGRGALSPLWLP